MKPKAHFYSGDRSPISFVPLAFPFLFNVWGSVYKKNFEAIDFGVLLWVIAAEGQESQYYKNPHNILIIHCF